MSYTTVYNEVVFIEGNNPKATRKGSLKANLMGFGAQLKTLNDVKANLAMQAKLRGCNCVLDFKYGQKSSWISLDNVKFYGSGAASVLSSTDYGELIQATSKRL